MEKLAEIGVNFGRWRRRRALAQVFRDPGEQIVHLEFETNAVGMFAQLSACIQAAEIAERYDKRPVMRLTSGNYRETGGDPEWFGAFFMNEAAVDLAADHSPTLMWDGSDLPFKAQYTSLNQAKQLFDRHFAVRPEFKAEVSAFASANSIGPQTVAIHYRGTDKLTEAPTQEIADVLESVERHIATLNDSLRSSGGTPVHTNNLAQGNRTMGRDALLNCLMLARCGTLCRTSSFLSAWSAIFNPQIKIAMLNAPYQATTWLPEAIILPSAPRI